MLKHFWALPAFLRLALCSPSAFSVHNDILAFPQYEVVYSQSFISLHDASTLLGGSRQPDSRSQDEESETLSSETTADLSLNLDTQQQQQHASSSNVPPTTSERDTYERLVLEGRPYLCTIPYVPPPSAANTTASFTAEELEEELARATNHGLELLKEMQENCIYYFGGWWVYSFCYNEGIRQFHPLPAGRAGVPMYPPVEDTTVQSFQLGRFPKQPTQQRKSGTMESSNPTLDGTSSLPADDGTTQPAPNALPTPESSLQTRGETHYLVQKLTGGTSCDLTGLDRRVEVQFHCNPGSQDKIHMIKETTSCVYLMVIHTPRLCNDLAFLPPQEDKPHPITCQEIIAPGSAETSWLAKKSAELEAASSQSTSKPRTPLVIGGVEVGAQRLVGSTPELTIRASNIVASSGGGAASTKQQKFLATLAKSDGRYTSSLGEKEMGELGLKGTKEELNTWIEQMQKKAGEGVPWRLDVVRDGEGLQFLGIVGDALEDGEGKGSGKGKGEGKGKGKGKGKGSGKGNGKADADAAAEKAKTKAEAAAQAGDEEEDEWIELELELDLDLDLDDGDGYEDGDGEGGDALAVDDGEGVGSEEEYM